MPFITITTALIVIGTIGAGLFFTYRSTEATKPLLKRALRINLFVFIPLLVGAIVVLAPQASMAATTAANGNGLGYIAAALSTGMATIGTGYAVGVVGSAALGAVSENEKILGKTLIFVGLAEGIAIYGLIISIMILGSL